MTRMTRHDPSRAGFTLIELVTSSVLAVLLMTAVLTILTQSIKDTRQLGTETSRLPSSDLLSEQLHRDIQNARGMRTGPNTLQLYGYLATDEETLLPTLERALVTYRIQTIGEHPVLIRAEQSTGGIAAGRQRSEIVWTGARQIETASVGTRLRLPGDNQNQLVPPDTGGLPPISPTVRIILRDASGNVLLRETIRHHRHM